MAVIKSIFVAASRERERKKKVPNVWNPISAEQLAIFGTFWLTLMKKEVCWARRGAWGITNNSPIPFSYLKDQVEKLSSCNRYSYVFKRFIGMYTTVQLAEDCPSFTIHTKIPFNYR